MDRSNTVKSSSPTVSLPSRATTGFSSLGEGAVPDIDPNTVR